MIWVSLPRLVAFSGMGGSGCVLTRGVVGTTLVIWMEVASELSVLQTSDPSAGPAKPSGALMLELLLEGIIADVVGLRLITCEKVRTVQDSSTVPAL